MLIHRLQILLGNMVIGSFIVELFLFLCVNQFVCDISEFLNYMVWYGPFRSGRNLIFFVL